MKCLELVLDEQQQQHSVALIISYFKYFATWKIIAKRTVKRYCRYYFVCSNEDEVGNGRLEKDFCVISQNKVRAPKLFFKNWGW